MKAINSFSTILFFSVLILLGCQASDPAISPLVESSQLPSTEKDDLGGNFVYIDPTYGFELTFPENWAGYIVQNRELSWGENGKSDSVDFGFKAADDTFNSIFNINVHSKDQWASIQAEEGPKPTYLGENDQYIFGVEYAQEVAQDLIQKLESPRFFIHTFQFN